jgi:hypothetical protein
MFGSPLVRLVQIGQVPWRAPNSFRRLILSQPTQPLLSGTLVASGAECDVRMNRKQQKDMGMWRILSALVFSRSAGQIAIAKGRSFCGRHQLYCGKKGTVRFA